MSDDLTVQMLRHLEATLQSCRLALRLPGEKSRLVYPDAPWNIVDLDYLLAHQGREIRQGLPTGWAVLRVLPWSPALSAGALLCLQLEDEPGFAQLEPMSSALRLFWEREEARTCHTWRTDLLHKLLDHSLELINLMATDGRLFYHTTSFARLVGLPDPTAQTLMAEGRGLSLNYLDFIHNDDLPLVRDCLLRIGRGEGTMGPVEYRLDGQVGGQPTIHYLESWFTSVESDSDVLSVVVHSRDVTARKAAARALISRERRYRQVLDELHQAVFEVDSSGKLAFVNSSWEKITGCAPQQSIGRALSEFFMLDEPLEMPLHREVQCRSGPREPWWVELWLHPQRSGRGGMLGLALDVTERKLMQRQLDKMAQLVDQAVEIVLLLDNYGRVTYANPAYSLKTAISCDTLVWTPFFQTFRPESGVEEEILAEVVGNGLWSGRMYCFDAEGSELVLEAVISRVHDERGDFREFLATCRDVTREVLLEDQLRASQRLESLGLLAGGVAHDFNNLVQVIMGNCSLEQATREASGEEPSLYLIDVMEATERAQRLTRQLLTFASRQPVEKAPVELSRLVQETMQVIHRWFPSHIEYEFLSTAGEAWVECDPGQVEQVVLNLAVNARDAMPEGGRLSVHLDPHEDGWKLTFKDTGVGMSAQERQRIFEPFYSTKGKDLGTGLGLSVVYGIVRSHAGQIQVHSTPGEGTSFEIFLPGLRGQAVGELATSTILLVEDEPLVRNFHARLLEKHGFRVITASDGVEAVDLFSSQPEAFDALLLDIGLPIMDGIEAFRRMRQKRAGIPALFCSALTQFQTLPASNSKTDFVAKPVDGKVLVDKLSQLLRARPKAS